MSTALARRAVAAAASTSVRRLLADAQAELAAARCETPRLDAELLLAHVLGVPRERLVLEPGLELRGRTLSSFRAAMRRRAADREPVAYITGRRHFRRLLLAVDARVLIPRPETELLVDAALELPRRARVLDLATGSGAVALAVKDERPDLRVSASDISAGALAVARVNAARLGLDVRFLQADLMRGLAGDFDAVLCNPPYVATAQRASLAPEILRHEPPAALMGGRDGLAVVTRLVEQLAERADVKQVALEVGAGQATVVSSLLEGAGFLAPRRVCDLAGVERALVATRAA